MSQVHSTFQLLNAFTSNETEPSEENKRITSSFKRRIKRMFISEIESSKMVEEVLFPSVAEEEEEEEEEEIVVEIDNSILNDYFGDPLSISANDFATVLIEDLGLHCLSKQFDSAYNAFCVCRTYALNEQEEAMEELELEGTKR